MGLDERDFNRIDPNELDCYITGNYGEDQFIGDEMDVEPEPKLRKVYITTNESDGGFYLYDAYTQEQLSDRWENNRHNLIDLAIANDWDVVDGPQTAEGEEDDDEVVDNDFDFYDKVMPSEAPDFEGYPGTGGFYA